MSDGFAFSSFAASPPQLECLTGFLGRQKRNEASPFLELERSAVSRFEGDEPRRVALSSLNGHASPELNASPSHLSVAVTVMK